MHDVEIERWGSALNPGCDGSQADTSCDWELGQGQPAASCAELTGGGAPLEVAFGEEASVAHDVQTITMALPSTSKLTQRLTFTAIDCPPDTDCMANAFYGYVADPSPLIRTTAEVQCKASCHSSPEPWATKCGWASKTCASCTECIKPGGWWTGCWTSCAVATQGSACPNGACGEYDACCRSGWEDGPPCNGLGANGWHVCMHTPREVHPNAVQLRHGGKLSSYLDLESATAADIELAFEELRDDTYRALKVTAIERNVSTVSWTFELSTPWGSCAPDAPHPPLEAQLTAKAVASATVLSGASCLHGGVDVSLDAGDGATAFLSWDATAA